MRVAGPTLRGHIIRGLEDPDPSKLLFRQVFLDTVQLARVVMAFPEVDPGRVGCWGASQGGALALACAALEPRIRRTAPVFPFLCDYQRVWEMDQAKDAYEELRLFFRAFDPRHEREAAIFTRLGYIDVQHLAPRIRADIYRSIERLKAAGVVLKKKCESAGIGVMAKCNLTKVGQSISFIVRDGIADRIEVETNGASLTRTCESTA